jgi:hypothetical protein
MSTAPTSADPLVPAESPTASGGAPAVPTLDELGS